MTAPSLRAPLVTALLALMAVPNVITGAWGVLWPAHWYEHFPGWAPRLVAAHPPFNGHLVSDAAAGVLALGVAALVPLVWRHRDVTLTAMIVVLAFAWPHAAFHLRHPSDLLDGAEQAVNDIALVGVVLAAAVVAVVAWRSSPRR